jgi:hypothetical protein
MSGNPGNQPFNGATGNQELNNLSDAFSTPGAL